MKKKIIIINAVSNNYRDSVNDLNDSLWDNWEIIESNVYNDCIFYYELKNDKY